MGFFLDEKLDILNLVLCHKILEELSDFAEPV